MNDTVVEAAVCQYQSRQHIDILQKTHIPQPLIKLTFAIHTIWRRNIRKYLGRTFYYWPLSFFVAYVKSFPPSQKRWPKRGASAWFCQWVSDNAQRRTIIRLGSDKSIFVASKASAEGGTLAGSFGCNMVYSIHWEYKNLSELGQSWPAGGSLIHKGNWPDSFGAKNVKRDQHGGPNWPFRCYDLKRCVFVIMIHVHYFLSCHKISGNRLEWLRGFVSYFFPPVISGDETLQQCSLKIFVWNFFRCPRPLLRLATGKVYVVWRGT